MAVPGISPSVLRLRKAIERDQLRLEYQPKADLRTGRISGVEALVRWHAPRKGVIKPDEYDPLMTYIRQLGRQAGR